MYKGYCNYCSMEHCTLLSPSDVRVQTSESVANRRLPCVSYGSFKMFKIPTSEFSTVGMCRQFHACAYEYLTMVTEGLVIRQLEVHGLFATVAQGII